MTFRGWLMVGPKVVTDLAASWKRRAVGPKQKGPPAWATPSFMTIRLGSLGLEADTPGHETARVRGGEVADFQAPVAADRLAREDRERLRGSRQIGELGDDVIGG